MGIFPNQTFIDLSLIQFGRESCDPGHSFGPAKRGHYLFHYVISGLGKLYADNSAGETETYNIRSGQGFLIFPEQTNTYIADNDHPWEYIWLEFDGLRVRPALLAVGLTPNDPVYRAHMGPLRTAMVDEMIYIVGHKEDSPFRLIGHLYLFLDALLRSVEPVMNQTGNKMQDFYIREALLYIERNFTRDISVEEIAKNSGIERTYFSKLFKKMVGTSPQQFLINYRMTKATELLTLTDRSIKDIGEMVGYANQLHFSRAFKSIYGVSPRDWRKAHHKTNRTGGTAAQ